MLAKQVLFKTAGMNKDLSESSFNSLFAFDNRNVRLSTIDNNTLLSLSNEKGTLDMKTTFSGYPIGHAVIDDKIVLFTADYIGVKSVSTIYLISIDEDGINSEVMYLGELEFSPKYPLETLAVYENLNAIKVYWVDGINQPRVINIANYYEDNSVFLRGPTTLFDFIPTMLLKETPTINKSIGSSGTFSPGTILYAFTYYNLHGALSNIFYTSSLYYISPTDRGGSPDERVSSAFSIKLTGLDPNFNYVRIYSIHRSSIDATPTVKRVADLEIINSTLARTIKTPVSVSTLSFNTQSINNDYIATEGISEKPLSILTTYTGTSWADEFYSDGSDAGGNYRQLDLDKCRNSEAYSVGKSKWLKFRGVTYYASSNLLDRASWSVKLYYSGSEFSVSNVTKVVILSSVSTVYNVSTNTDNIRKIDYIDDGESGDTIDPTELLFIGGREIIAGTITLKDNTLFLGNLEDKGQLVELSIKDTVRGYESSFHFINERTIHENSNKGAYPYTSLLNKNLSEISTFMRGETYRVGLQFLKHTGEWTEPIFIGDKENNITLKTNGIDSLSVNLVTGKLTIPAEDVEEFKKRYKKVRPLIVFPSYTDRTVICLGVLNPTVFNVSDRSTNSPFAQSSWFFRPNSPYLIDNL